MLILPGGLVTIFFFILFITVIKQNRRLNQLEGPKPTARERAAARRRHYTHDEDGKAYSGDAVRNLRRSLGK